ncbi:hypothetical protein [Pseudonocardia broussonetiae]|uniref:hypothetical protein n=1 Tax=Pseudonocardia broussonetiae TaxID=2736640 RepID=UPI001962B950|nr:hypothetical protein [Pseudonocardia broussonetiae]
MLTALRIGDPRRGAALIVALALAPRYAARTGLYVTARGHREIRPGAPADDPAARARLWTATAQLVASLGVDAG